MGPYGLIRAIPFGYNTFFSFILIYVTIHNDSETHVVFKQGKKGY